jgi:hypothetical protein
MSLCSSVVALLLSLLPIDQELGSVVPSIGMQEGAFVACYRAMIIKSFGMTERTLQLQCQNIVQLTTNIFVHRNIKYIFVYHDVVIIR